MFLSQFKAVLVSLRFFKELQICSDDYVHVYPAYDKLHGHFT